MKKKSPKRPSVYRPRSVEAYTGQNLRLAPPTHRPPSFAPKKSSQKGAQGLITAQPLSQAKKKKLQKQRQIDAKRLGAVLLTLTLLVGSGLLFATVMDGYGKITVLNLSIHTKDKELKELQTIRKEQELKLETFNRSDVISQIAKDKLGMQPPLPEQTVYINVR